MPSPRRILERRLGLETLEARAMLAGDFELVADVAVAPMTEGSGPSDFARLGDQTFFFATTGDEGRELWKTDGTAVGTVLVKDINPDQASGVSSTYPASQGIVAFGGAVYFRATDGTSGFELWKSDGTEAGTERVKDMRPGSGDGLPSIQPSSPWLTEVGGALYFAANDGSNGVELWKTDGTEAGTVLVKNAASGSFNPTGLFNVGGALLFRGTVSGQTAIWRSDGTAAGTVRVSTQSFSPLPATASTMAEVNGQLFFSATGSGRPGQELWKSDGTAAGTVVVKDLNAGGPLDPIWLTNAGGTIFFMGATSQQGRELWKSDGTAAGTTIVKDVNPGANSSVSVPVSSPVKMAALGSQVYFTTSQPTTRLWRSDGTEAGTVALTATNFDATCFTTVNDRLYFVGGNAFAPSALWQIDSAATSPTFVAPPDPSFQVSGQALYNSGGTLYFAGALYTPDYELMKAEGSSPTISQVKDIRTGTTWSNPENMFLVGDTLYFGVYVDGAPELWKSDGTAGGTSRVKRFDSYFIADRPTWMTNVNGIFYFGMHEVNNLDLWRSDGTEAGTYKLKDIVDVGTYPEFLTNVDGVLYFLGYDETHGRELWRSDGTAAGTWVFDIKPGPDEGVQSTNAATLSVHNSVVYFGADDGVHGNELWRSDGTVAGTYMVKEFAPGPEGLGVAEYFPSVSTGDFLYFTVTVYFVDGVFQPTTSIWRTDGTEAGTTQVTTLGQFESIADPAAMIGHRDRVYYLDPPADYETGLWTIVDGQTQLLSNFDGVSPLLSPRMVSVDDALFIYFGDFTGGTSLWKTDGTAEGTVQVAMPGIASRFTYPTAVGDALYFAAEAGSLNPQIWRVNSWETTATPVSSFVNATSLAGPQQLTNVGGLLFFSRDDNIHGRELWVQRATPGDFSQDDEFDGTDVLAWQRQLGSAVLPGAGADGDRDGDVDSDDLDVWIDALPEEVTPNAESMASVAASSAVDAVYAAGDFTALFAAAREYRPTRRSRLFA